MEFRPSEVAAAVAIAVGGESQTVDTEKAISLLTQHLEKVKEMGSNKRNPATKFHNFITNFHIAVVV